MHPPDRGKRRPETVLSCNGIDGGSAHQLGIVLVAPTPAGHTAHRHVPRCEVTVLRRQGGRRGCPGGPPNGEPHHLEVPQRRVDSRYLDFVGATPPSGVGTHHVPHAKAAGGRSRSPGTRRMRHRGRPRQDKAGDDRGCRCAGPCAGSTAAARERLTAALGGLARQPRTRPLLPSPAAQATNRSSHDLATRPTRWCARWKLGLAGVPS